MFTDGLIVPGCSFSGHVFVTEPAVVVCLSIVDMHADTVEAMSEIAAMLYKEYITSSETRHLVLLVMLERTFN